MKAVHQTNDLQSEYSFTRHAWERMNERGLPPAAVRLALTYGRTARIRGAIIHVVGRKEVERYRQEGIDLSSIEGVQVVCIDGGPIVTVYRNRDFRGLRPRSRRTHRPHAR